MNIKIPTRSSELIVRFWEILLSHSRFVEIPDHVESGKEHMSHVFKKSYIPM